ATGSAERTWQAFLINTVFWGGLAQAGVMLSVIWQITDAKWGRPWKRLAEGFGAFLPVSFLMFIVVFFGAKYLYEWVDNPLPTKTAYLNVGFFVTRNLIGFLVLYGITFFFLLASIKPDLGFARKAIPGWGGEFAERLLRGYGEHEGEVLRLEQLSRRLAPLLGVVYAAVMSMVAFDFVMSLDQVWFSTLFGVFFFVGNLYSALALMLIIAARVRTKPGLAEYMTINRYHDLAKLTFAIACLWTYMIFSQYLVIWYSTLPEEAPYLITRSLPGTPWYYLFWTLFFILFLLPFLGLMPRTVCRNPRLTSVIALVLLIGQWFAHYVLVVPSIQDRHGAPHMIFGTHEVLLTVGFVGMFFLCYMALMSKVPVLPVSDKHLCKSWHGH
ncbi:MAG: molybdopterin oxidoreductase, partial [Candidatus Lambdaproteobacteria bacterium]|nr:molybdopterin oxidoreductase [Candidatus Lambdaproteobacteria bacterium]